MEEAAAAAREAAAAEEEEEWRQWRRGPVRGEPRGGDGEGPRLVVKAVFVASHAPAVQSDGV